MDNRFYLDRETGKVIDQRRESLIEFRSKTPNWEDRLVTISKKVYDLLKK